MVTKKKKKCKCGCNKEGFIWSQGMLKECFLRLNPPKKITYKSAKQKIKDVEKREIGRASCRERVYVLV